VNFLEIKQNNFILAPLALSPFALPALPLLPLIRDLICVMSACINLF